MKIFTAVIKQRSQHAVTKTEIHGFFRGVGLGSARFYKIKVFYLYRAKKLVPQQYCFCGKMFTILKAEKRTWFYCLISYKLL